MHSKLGDGANCGQVVALYSVGCIINSSGCRVWIRLLLNSASTCALQVLPCQSQLEFSVFPSSVCVRCPNSSLHSLGIFKIEPVTTMAPSAVEDSTSPLAGHPGTASVAGQSTPWRFVPSIPRRRSLSLFESQPADFAPDTNKILPRTNRGVDRGTQTDDLPPWYAPIARSFGRKRPSAVHGKSLCFLVPLVDAPT